ncbi:MAG: hypothetical protein ACR2P3_02145 [Geminicoccaceae bacterium]
MAKPADQPRCPYLRIDHQTIRAPRDGKPHDRNWVVKAQIKRRAVVIKLYQPGDPLCRHETIAVKHARRMASRHAAPRWLDIDPARLLLPGCPQQSLVVSHLPGQT